MEKYDDNHVYWTWLECGQWKFTIAATNLGLCYIGSQNANTDELFEWSKKKLPAYELIENTDALKKYIVEIIDYLQGAREVFSLPVDLHGTAFQQSVWEALKEVPYGQTVSYTHIANEIGKPGSVRAVGTAIGANPVLMVIPCHRIIAKSGKLSGYRGGLEMKEQLLELEQSV